MSNFKEGVATNVCSEQVCTSYVSNPLASLSCTDYGNYRVGGWPVKGGRIQIQFFTSCPPIDNNINICFGAPLQLPFCAPPPAIGANWNTKEFITPVGYFATRTSQQGTAAKLRWWARIYDVTQTTMPVDLTIQWLNQTAGVNSWQNFYSTTLSLKIVGTYARNQGNGFKSDPEYLPISVNGILSCQVDSMSVLAGLEPLRYSCGAGEGDLTCGLWDGTDYLTCAKGVVEDKTGVQLPVPFLMGLNANPCGTTTSQYCNCDECKVVAAYPQFECLYNGDPTFNQYVLTNYAEPIDAIQSIQIATGSPFPIMIKTVNQVRYVYWCPTGNLANWTRAAFNIVQAAKPTIVQVEDPTYRITIYFTKFPSNELLPECPTTSGMNVVSANLTREQRLATRVSGGCGCGKKK